MAEHKALAMIIEELDQLLDKFDESIGGMTGLGHRDLTEVRRHYSDLTGVRKRLRKFSNTLGQIESIDIDDDLRIVENAGSTLESMDEDCDILGVPLKLDEACAFDFSKHVDAIVGSEESRAADSKKHQNLNQAQLNKQEYDRRYKEMPRDRIKFKR